jgi:hypothetical protein
MEEQYSVREGYLLLADISGYTKFLTGTELEHAQAIIHELTMLVRERLAPPMEFVQLEGDAVFCYADARVFRNGESFIELIEVCYFDFSNRLLNMARNTTCPCSACRAIGSLDLKFVCHYGTFVIEARAGGVDLAPMLAAMRDARRLFIGSDDADLVFTFEAPVPPALAWKYVIDPIERQRWVCRHFSKKPDRVTRNAHGRVGQGTSMHCNHGPGTWSWEFVDWRPYNYVTCDVTGPRFGKYLGQRDEFDTYEFVPTQDGGTQVVHRIRLKRRGRLSLFTARMQFRYVTAYWRWTNKALLKVINEDQASTGQSDVDAAGLSTSSIRQG